MKPSCCLISTNLIDRLSLLDNTIASIEKHDNIFEEKILSVDMFNGGVDFNWFLKYSQYDWKIINKNVTKYRSMILNQKNAILNAKSDIVFYSEDDIIINKLPSIDTINILFRENIINNKRVGFICYNNHVWINFNENPTHIIEYINNPKNYVKINNDTFLIKNNVVKDRYYLNFPVSIFNKELFVELHEYCFTNCKGEGVEGGMTKAWFDKNSGNNYEVLIYLKNEILDDIAVGKVINVLDFYNYANMNFWNNDKNLRHNSIVNKNNSVVF